MDHFNYQGETLYCEEVALADIVSQVGAPCYVYSRATLERHWHAFDKALAAHPHKICYAVKANSNLAVLQCLAKLGSGFDIVSRGELERVLLAGGKPENIVFSGVGKTKAEITRALEVGIHCINVESEAELALISQVASEFAEAAPIALRVNPDVDAKTHPYISTGLSENKFGIPMDSALSLYKEAAADPNLHVTGIDCHIGSQLTDVQPFLDALDRVLTLVDALADDNITIDHIDIGGGLGVRYAQEEPTEPFDYAASVLEKLKPRTQALYMEPGRAIMANAGVFITQVLFEKSNGEKRFLLVDGAMNDLLRPSLYQAYHDIVPCEKHSSRKTRVVDIVGPVCETGDFLGKARELNAIAGDLLAVRGAGAYGFVMSSQYNSRPRVAEVLVDGATFHVVRDRETIADLYEHERLLDEK